MEPPFRPRSSDFNQKYTFCHELCFNLIKGWVDSVTPASTSASDETSLAKVKITAPPDVKIGHETQGLSSKKLEHVI